MRTLALEFSSSRRSAAVVEEGQVIGCLQETPERSIGPASLVRDVLGQCGLKPGDVGRVAVGLGPGSYTGIRVAIAFAQGWELALGIRVVGVSSVECLAWRVWLEGTLGDVAILVDAQRGECYVARYRMSPGSVEVVVPLALCSLEEAGRLAAAGCRLIGPGLDGSVAGLELGYPEAGMVGVLAWGREGDLRGRDLAPIYLRETGFVRAPAPRVIPARTGHEIAGQSRSQRS